MNQIIKKILDPGTYSKNMDIVLLMLRLTVGIFMLTHGIGKFERLFGSEAVQFHDPLGVGAPVSLALAVFAEVFCSILVIVGWGTRLAAIPLLFTMLVATFVIHIDDGFGKQELPLLYAAIYIAILVLGAGKYSVDHLISKRKKTVSIQ